MIVKMIQNLGNKIEAQSEKIIVYKGPRRTKQKTNSDEQHNN